MPILKSWSLQDAKNRFSAVADMAWQGEPQIVTRRGKPLVVVISYAQYEQQSTSQARKTNIVDAFRDCPDELDGLIQPRQRNISRRRRSPLP